MRSAFRGGTCVNFVNAYSSKCPNVKNKGPWDPKQYGIGDYEFEAAGNFNYGATGKACGLFFEKDLLQMAGWAQVKAGTSSKYQDWGKPGWFIGKLPVPFTGSGSFGDDPDDQYWIQQGIKYYKGGGSWK